MLHRLVKGLVFRMRKRLFRLVALVCVVAALLPLLAACGGDAVTLITVNGIALKKSDMMLHLFTAKYAMYQESIEAGYMSFEDVYHLDEKTLSSEYSKGVSVRSYILQSATSSAISAMLYRAVAEEEGISLTKAEKESARQDVEDWINSLGGTAKYNTFLKENHVTENALYRYYCDMILGEKIQEEFGAYGKYEMTQEEKDSLYRDYLDSYYTVDYIYWSKRDTAVGLLLSDKEIAAKYSSARECLSRLKAGEDFYTLRKEYSDEAYKTVTFCDGMVDELFGDTAMALRVNEFSNIVEDTENDCYYILHRIATTDDQWEKFYSSCVYSKFNAFMSDYGAKAEYVYKKAYTNLEFD